MRLQVFFEVESLLLVREGTIPSQIPWREFRGMRRFTGIMVRQPTFQIGSCTGVILVGKTGAANNVNVPHRAFYLALLRAQRDAPSGTRMCTDEQGNVTWSGKSGQSVVALRAMPDTLRFRLRGCATRRSGLKSNLQLLRDVLRRLQSVVALRAMPDTLRLRLRGCATRSRRRSVVEPGGIEPPTSCMPCKRSPS